MDSNTRTALVTLRGRTASLGHLALLLGLSEHETLAAIEDRTLFECRRETNRGVDPSSARIIVELTPAGAAVAGRLA